jgi:hypothetical protein
MSHLREIMGGIVMWQGNRFERIGAGLEYRANPSADGRRQQPDSAAGFYCQEISVRRE